MTEEEFNELVEEVQKLTNEQLLAAMEATTETIRQQMGFLDLLGYEEMRRQQASLFST